MPNIKTGISDYNYNTKNTSERLILLDQLISQHLGGKSGKDLLSSLNNRLKEKVGIDTLNHDLRDLRDLVAINTNDEVQILWTKNAGYYYSKNGYSYYRNSVNEEDRNLLMLAYSVFSVFNGSSLPTKFGKLINKVLADSLTKEKDENLKLNEFIQFESKFQYSNKWIFVILENIQEKKSLKIFYQKSGEEVEKEKIVCPYFLKQYRNKWYMIAYDFNSTRDHKVNVFALESIMDLEPHGKQYFLDPTFNPEHYFNYALGIWHRHDKDPIKVQLEFNNTDYFNTIKANPLHHSQQVISEGNKSLIIELEVYDSPELPTLIKSYGNEVKVIAPIELAKVIAESATKVTDMYKNFL